MNVVSIHSMTPAGSELVGSVTLENGKLRGEGRGRDVLEETLFVPMQLQKGDTFQVDASDPELFMKCLPFRSSSRVVYLPGDSVVKGEFDERVELVAKILAHIETPESESKPEPEPEPEQPKADPPEQHRKKKTRTKVVRDDKGRIDYTIEEEIE